MSEVRWMEGRVGLGDTIPSGEGQPSMTTEVYTDRDQLEQRLEIERLKAQQSLAETEGRLESKFDSISERLDRGLAEFRLMLQAMDAKYEERFKSIDWKFNLIVGLLIAILVGSVIVPLLKPKEEPHQQPQSQTQPIIINNILPTTAPPTKK